MNSSRKYRVLATLVATAWAHSVPAFAQQDDKSEDSSSESFVLDEIIVTARKRQETLQESPVAISALNAEALIEAGVTNLKDLQTQVPGLSFSDQGFKSAAIFIRGIGQRETTAALDPGVGVYINNIYIARTDSQLLDTVDTESVQILRGPQGTLFGKNSTGGAILITTIAPHTEGFEGTLSARVGNYGRRDAKFSANIPLNDDNLAARISVNSIQSDGYLKNIYDGDMYADENRLAASATLNWQASDSFNVDVFEYWSKQNENGAGVNCKLINPTAPIVNFILPAQDRNPNGTTFGEACRQSENIAEDRNISIDGPSRFEMNNSISALTLSWEIDDLTIKSISSYSFQNDVVVQDDVDASAVPAVANGTITLLDAAGKSLQNGYGNFTQPDGEDRTQISQEFQFTGSAFDESLSYTLGLFYAKEELENMVFTQQVGYNGLSYYSDFGLIVPQFRGNTSDMSNETYAVYGQTTYDFTNELNLTVGIRYTRETRERDATLYSADCEAIVAAGLIRGASDALCAAVGQIAVADPVDLQNFFVNPPSFIPIESVGNTKDKADFSKVTPAATLAYNMPVEGGPLRIDDSLLYFTWSKGYKAGGFEVKALEMQKFNPESVTNYEIGWKLDALDQRLRFNAAAYYMDYEDLQVRVTEIGSSIADVAVYISNAGRAELRGLEMELTALPADHLTLQFSLNLIDAKYKEFDQGRVDLSSGLPQNVVDDRSDEPYGSVPELTYSLSIAYDWLTKYGRITPRLTMSYQDEVFIGLDAFSGLENYQVAGGNTPNDPNDDQFRNFRELSTLDDITLFNARLSYWDTDEVLGITLYVNNLADEFYYAGGAATVNGFGIGNLSQGTPRTYGLEFVYRI